MYLQLKFSIPELISQGLNDKDMVSVEILPEMFTEELKVNPTSKIAKTDSKFVFEEKLSK